MQTRLDTASRSAQHFLAEVNANDEQLDQGTGDRSRARKKKLSARMQDETCRWLFVDTTDLLDDILLDPLSIDYFNVYLALPIFGQRLLCHRRGHQFEFDPPLLAKHQSSVKIHEETKRWLVHCRIDNYIRTDIYIESLLAVLLSQTETSQAPGNHRFATAASVHDFHQFLQSTAGMKYWDFFIDTMRFLRSRHLSRSTRLDNTPLNFICKYYSRYEEFRSITIDQDPSSMPESNTPDAVCFQMAIKAKDQLRLYWLHRYLTSSSFQPCPSQVELSIDRAASITAAPSADEISSDHGSHREEQRTESPLVHFTLDRISYIKHNPRQYIPMQPTITHPYHAESQVFTQSDETSDRSTIVHPPSQSESSIFEFGDRSIDDYCSNDNLELFYRVLLSDSLAGCPFLDFLAQTRSTGDDRFLQTCIHCIADAEILLSITSDKLRERIIRQFILKYLQATSAEQLPALVFEQEEQQRREVMEELFTEENKHYSSLWKTLLNLAKLLLPPFMQYIQFDRLRFLLQGKGLDQNPILHDLRQQCPLINFEPFLADQKAKETDPTNLVLAETEQSIQITCMYESIDLRGSWMNTRHYTSEKLINTDEQCQYPPLQRYVPLTQKEFEQELKDLCPELGWKEMKATLGPSFNVQSTTNMVTFIGDPTIDGKTETSHLPTEESMHTSVEMFTADIMHEGRRLFEIDRFVSNLIDDGTRQVQADGSLKSSDSDHSSSSLSPLFEEILVTESSSSRALPDEPMHGINQNAFARLNTEHNALSTHPFSEEQGLLLPTKIVSPIGSYFINPSTPAPAEVVENLDPSIHAYLQDHQPQSILTEFQLPTTLSKDRDVKSIDPTNQRRCSEIRYAPKDQSSEVQDTAIERPTSYFGNEDRQQLLDFIRDGMSPSQWPVQEYIGRQGHRAWRALKLAVDISGLSMDLMSQYHQEEDWFTCDNQLGSFSERAHPARRTE